MADHPDPTDAIEAVTHPCPHAFYASLADGDGIASSAPAVRRVLNDPSALVRPPDQPVPPHLIGTPAGRLFGRLARMNDSQRHVGLRAIVDGLLAAIDVDAMLLDARRRAVEASDLEALMREVPVDALAAALGFEGSITHHAQALAAAFAPGADASTEAAASAAAVALTAGCPDDDVAANRAGLLFQAHDACAALIGSLILEEGLAPVHNTRRFRPEPVLVVLATAALGDPDLAFGAGPHRCPAADLAPHLARSVVEARPDLRRNAPAHRFLPSQNARLPMFSDG